MSRAGRLLLAAGLVTEAQLGEAADLKGTVGGTLGLNLVRAGALDERALRQAFVEGLGLEPVDEASLFSVSDRLAALVPARVAVELRAVPVALDGDLLVVAVADPTDDAALASLRRATGLRLLVQVASESAVSAALERLYGTAAPSALPVASASPPASPAPAPALLTMERRKTKPPPRTDGAGDERISRPAVLLEGSYEKIRPADLPGDASAGYIPLTEVKRSGSTPPPAAVVEVRPIHVGAQRGTASPERAASPKPVPKRGAAGSTPPPRSPEDSWDVPAPEPAPAGSLQGGPRQLETIVRAVAEADRREGAVALALEAMLGPCRRAAFFTVKRTIVEGHAAAGAGLDRNTVRQVWIPLASPSTLRQACEARKPLVGPLGDSRTDKIFAAALGGRKGDSVLVPVVVGGQVVGLLYGDDLRSTAPSTAAIERLGAALRA